MELFHRPYHQNPCYDWVLDFPELLKTPQLLPFSLFSFIYPLFYFFFIYYIGLEGGIGRIAGLAGLSALNPTTST